MIHIHEFNSTDSEYKFRYSNKYIEPNISFIDRDTNDILIYDKNQLFEPVTLTCITSGIIYWKADSSSLTKKIEYMKNTDDWVEIESTTSGVQINVNAGDVVRFRGENNTYGNKNYCNKLETSISCYLSGNIMSLIHKDRFWKCFEFDTTVDSHLANMFEYCNNLEIVNDDDFLLPATTLGEYTYYKLFRGCSKLNSKLTLPAKVMTPACYGRMFESTGLTTTPDLISDTIAPNCYYKMFNSCTSLVNTCDLLSKTTAGNCYTGMYGWCTSLTKSPKIYAENLVSSSAQEMFTQCNNLQQITCYAKTIASGATSTWVTSVSATGTFYKDKNTTWATGTSGIPEGWTIKNYN